MAIATWKDEVIAASDDVVHVEGNAYFPREALKEQYFEESQHTSICPWKGKARYLHIVVDGKRNDNAAWYYPKPSFLARNIKNRVAFWNGVRVDESVAV